MITLAKKPLPAMAGERYGDRKQNGKEMLIVDKEIFISENISST